jgi:hypothetical protein
LIRARHGGEQACNSKREGYFDMRRIAAWFAVVAGITLIAFTFGEHLVSRSHDAQKIADHYQPLMSKQGLDDLSSGFDAVKAAGAQLDANAEPQLQRAMGMSNDAFAAYVARAMPGIHAFDVQAPGVVALVGPVIGQMQAARGDYARASGIPTSWLPLSSAPWLFLGIGALLIAVGALALWKRGALAGLALLAVGLGIVIAPLVVSIPSKVDAAVRVSKLGAVGLAPATGQKAVGATKLFDGMVADVRTKLEPALAAASPSTDFTLSYPTLSGFADEWQRSTSAKSHALSDSQVALAGTFANAHKIPLRPIPWLFIGPGLILALLACATLVPALSRTPSDAQRARALSPS